MVKLWVLGSNPNGITKSLSNIARNRFLSKRNTDVSYL